MFDRLDQMEARYEDLGRQLSDPKIVNDQENYRKVSKQHRDLEALVEKFREYRSINTGISDARAMLSESDPEIKEMAQAELNALEPRLEPIEEALKVMLLPKDPNDEKNVVLELRAGTGGDEAALFVAEVFRMYLRFAEQHKWKVEVLSQTESGIGNGLKDVTAIIEGDHVFSQMKYESGVHRVQRVPATETQGRVHTSAITVAVLPKRKRSTSRSKPRTSVSTPSALRPRRPVGQHHLFCRPHYPLADQHGRLLPGREIADQEPRKGNACPARPPLRG